jgi:hypothetical protein
MFILFQQKDIRLQNIFPKKYVLSNKEIEKIVNFKILQILKKNLQKIFGNFFTVVMGSTLPIY